MSTTTSALSPAQEAQVHAAGAELPKKVEKELTQAAKKDAKVVKNTTKDATKAEKAEKDAVKTLQKAEKTLAKSVKKEQKLAKKSAAAVQKHQKSQADLEKAKKDLELAKQKSEHAKLVRKEKVGTMERVQKEKEISDKEREAKMHAASGIAPTAPGTTAAAA